MKNIIIKLLLRFIDIKGIAHAMVDEIMEPALKKVVADSKNPYDDIIMAATYQPIEDALKSEIDKIINRK